MVASARYHYFEFGYVVPVQPALQLWAHFGCRWAIFHVVGASPKAKVMYQYYQGQCDRSLPVFLPD
jgi:hypothetical protein